eukprot:gnl/MRDRNA2_/MRDRNA2_83613_c0_seq1.p1 gnl/MRDRNA2_/MRDRNA2_83613_c0~~gnl/MRDRNA2_/MRDRNA2_83613_c0_seq1.p1  ORF type:complete len:159 (-),score=12.95 gnl/MRDRNA2_/MRDRNA2_83613_c0_seq1:46-522(-)
MEVDEIMEAMSPPPQNADLSQPKQDGEISEELPLLIPRVDGRLTSLGSRYHYSGSCDPCGFAFSKVGCRAGILCERCHFKHKNRRKAGKKSKQDAKQKDDEGPDPSAASSSGAGPRHGPIPFDTDASTAGPSVPTSVPVLESQPIEFITKNKRLIIRL